MSETQMIIGGAENFWSYTEKDGYDITHPATPDGAKVYPRMTLQTRDSPAIIDPTKTALVIVDLQNYFLSPALGRPSESVGLQVTEKLVNQVIPACRKAGTSVLWLNWGLTPDDIETMPPTIIRGFSMDNSFVGDRKPPALGTDIGSVELEDGTKINAGNALMRDEWNAKSYRTLEEVAQSNDMRVWKNRISGFWGGSDVEDVLKSRGTRTLIFAGCNTDQCVGSSLTDAAWRGYDCLLLSDGTATTSPKFAQESTEFNMGGWGFLLSCKDLVDGVEMLGLEPTTAEERDCMRRV